MANVTITQTMPLTEAAPTYGGIILGGRMSQWQQRLRELLQERDEARAGARALWAANQRMEQFLGMAAHELRNPVTSSRLGVWLAARRLDPLVSQLASQVPDGLLASQFGTVRDLLTRAEANLERLVRLVGDLLDVSHLHTGMGQLALHPTRVDLRTIVRMAVDEQRQLAPARRMRLHLPARQALPVWADADRIHQVVTNYLTSYDSNQDKNAPSGAGHRTDHRAADRRAPWWLDSGRKRAGPGNHRYHPPTTVASRIRSRCERNRRSEGRKVAFAVAEQVEGFQHPAPNVLTGKLTVPQRFLSSEGAGWEDLALYVYREPVQIEHWVEPVVPDPALVLLTRGQMLMERLPSLYGCGRRLAQCALRNMVRGQASR